MGGRINAEIESTFPAEDESARCDMSLRARSYVGQVACLVMMVVAAIVGVPRAIASDQASLAGTWNFVSDSDGATADTGVAVTLSISIGSVSFSAVGPGQSATDRGTMSTKDNRITISLPGIGKSAADAPYTLSGSRLILPFKVLSDGMGTSTWSKGAETAEAKASAGAGPGSAGPASRPSSGDSSPPTCRVFFRVVLGATLDSLKDYTVRVSGADRTSQVANGVLQINDPPGTLDLEVAVKNHPKGVLIEPSYADKIPCKCDKPTKELVLEIDLKGKGSFDWDE